jgi:uncharacterized Zn finger protein (UPF0148 family)
MNKTFECPNCGAPLDYTESVTLTVRCPFCNNSVIVPEELRPPAPESVQATEDASQAATQPVDPVLAQLQELASSEVDPHQLKHISRIERRIVRRQERDEERRQRRQERRRG